MRIKQKLIDSFQDKEATIGISYECIVIGANHYSFDYDLIRKYGRRFVDPRGVYRHNPNGVVQF